MKSKLLYLILLIFISFINNTCLVNDTILEPHITQNKQNPIIIYQAYDGVVYHH